MSGRAGLGHYLDHASTSPLRPEARAAVLAALDLPLADPSRMHEPALGARAMLEEARTELATFLGARSRELVFTSGGTESVVSAVWGGAERGRVQVVSAVEHSAVRQAAARHGEVVIVPCDPTGRVEVAAVEAALDATAAAEVGMVHVQWGNHEVGTTHPIAAIAETCRARGVLLHVDAAQAAGHLPIAFGELGIDLLSISGHKLGGPPGTGALLVRRGVRIAPLMVGGDQERARRAGMENVVGAVGLAAAATSIDVTAEATRDLGRSDRIRRFLSSLDGVRLFGHPDHRLPHLVCAGLDDIEPQAVLLGLDRHGVRAHSGSACASESLEPSPVLAAMGVDAHRSLRVSVGWSTTDADLDALERALPAVLAELRALRR